MDECFLSVVYLFIGLNIVSSTFRLLLLFFLDFSCVICHLFSVLSFKFQSLRCLVSSLFHLDRLPSFVCFLSICLCIYPSSSVFHLCTFCPSIIYVSSVCSSNWYRLPFIISLCVVSELSSFICHISSLLFVSVLWSEFPVFYYCDFLPSSSFCSLSFILC